MNDYYVNLYDNFFDEITLRTLERKLKKIEFYDCPSHKQKFKSENNWPGLRSAELIEYHKDISDIILQRLGKQYPFNSSKEFSGTLFAHYRFDRNKESDWIHQDPVDTGVIIYMSETNLTSGTNFYENIDDDKEDNSLSVKYVKNRAMIFNGNKPHAPFGSFGTNIENGRLTINGFFQSK